MNYFVTAIGTDSGKSVFSAILVEMLHADYWKPIQSGQPRDTELVQSLISNEHSRFYKEGYLLETPVSPHAAARIDGVEIMLDQLHPPISNRDLVIEGAGGLLVPINDHDVVIDMAPRVNAEIILVSNYYLGSINHTLLSVAELQRRGVKIKGIVFNGVENEESKRIILLKTGLKHLLSIHQEAVVDQDMILKYASKLKANWNE